MVFGGGVGSGLIAAQNENFNNANALPAAASNICCSLLHLPAAFVLITERERDRERERMGVGVAGRQSSILAMWHVASTSSD